MKDIEHYRDEVYDVLCPLPVPLTLRFAQCHAIVTKLSECRCISCMEVCIALTEAMTAASLDANLAPQISSRLDQRMAEFGLQFRAALLTHEYLAIVQPTADTVDAVAKRMSELLRGLDMSLPLAELRTIIRTAATTDAAF